LWCLETSSLRGSQHPEKRWCCMEIVFPDRMQSAFRKLFFLKMDRRTTKIVVAH
jgi:hypothetical protein